jgi:Arc/MetJ-type ribon-helix-helix transcriptional regulator
MTITLRSDQEQLLRDIMRAGVYENAEDAIGSALEMLLWQNKWLAENHRAVDAKILEGIAELDRGEGIPEIELIAHMAHLKAQPD